uniref:Uncharacterized protein n=1 Tax=Capra hircus TaxID=9925 RepID=A0A8C2RGB3_CAPHI
VAMGVLTQTMGTWDRLVAYLSKRLDSVATGWPRCLRAIATVALLVQEAPKLTLGMLSLCCTCMGPYKERSLLTANRKDIKSKEENLTLLDAVWEPEKGSVALLGSPK